MMERGWVIALAHIRGGGELGKKWYDAGKGLQKWNSFYDFKACAEKVVAEGYTRPNRLAAKASSAGGLVLGVMANEYPNLFGALIMKVPFVDVLTSSFKLFFSLFSYFSSFIACC
jgi:oligopeptidase B